MSSPLVRTLQIALGAAFVGVAAAAVLDLHSHDCSCGTRWTHLGAFAGNDATGHICRGCGAEQLRKTGMFHAARGLHHAAVGGK